MKTKKYILWLLGLMLCATPVLTACSSSDDDSNGNGNNTEKPVDNSETAKYDDLAVFQNAICRIDSAGYLVDYNIGQALYDAEPQHLYIGVDDIEEAANWFRGWIAPDVELAAITPTTTDLTAQLTDTLGHSQGTIYFKAGSGQSVAEVTYSPETQLKYIDRITFLLNSAWPFNSGGSQWHRGDIHEFHLNGDCYSGLDSNDKTLNFVLIREGGNGVKPMWCAITNNSYNYRLGTFGKSDFELIISSSYCPSYSTAESIRSILTSDWSYFASKFNEAGEGKLEHGESYWIDNRYTEYLSTYHSMYIYDSGYTHGSKERSSKQPFLLKIDWLDDGARLFTVSDGTNMNSNYSCFNIFDGDNGTAWKSRLQYNSSDRADGSGKCVYVEFSCEDPIQPKRYYMTYHNWISDYHWLFKYCPTEWKLYGKKNSRSKTWEQIDYRKTDELSKRNPYGWQYVTCYFDIPASAQDEYRFFRLELWDASKSDDISAGKPVGIACFGFE